jgi:putative oxidoreductase
MSMPPLFPATPLLAHFLIGFYFVFYGFWNIYHWRPIVEDMTQKNIPLPFLILSCGIFWQTVAGFMIMLGIYVKLAALILIPFTILSVFIFHPFWKFRGEHRALNMNIFIANLTVSLSALLLLLNTQVPLIHIGELIS